MAGSGLSERRRGIYGASPDLALEHPTEVQQTTVGRYQGRHESQDKTGGDNPEPETSFLLSESSSDSEGEKDPKPYAVNQTPPLEPPTEEEQKASWRFKWFHKRQTGSKDSKGSKGSKGSTGSGGSGTPSHRKPSSGEQTGVSRKDKRKKNSKNLPLIERLALRDAKLRIEEAQAISTQDSQPAKDHSPEGSTPKRPSLKKFFHLHSRKSQGDSDAIEEEHLTSAEEYLLSNNPLFSGQNTPGSTGQTPPSNSHSRDSSGGPAIRCLLCPEIVRPAGDPHLSKPQAPVEGTPASPRSASPDNIIYLTSILSSSISHSTSTPTKPPHSTSTPHPSPESRPDTSGDTSSFDDSLVPAPLRITPKNKTDTPAPHSPLDKMNPPRVSRLLDPAMAAITKHKAEAIKLAREQSSAVQEMCRRAKSDVPAYEFEELIGKGSYGRVYKGHQLPSRKLVAIKVLDIDSIDYKSLRDFRDESINDFIRETKVMKQVKESGAKNINELIEAISIHSQLWLVCEYCPGGSVRTLMRATNDRLEEKFIIPIARELAAGLRAIHNAGIIHRDIKAANVLIHEEGKLQICDFGVAGVLQSQLDKRSTWIGTPHWMPPEMFSTRGEAHQYGSEIDVWAYGCTIFEIATGNPPNSNLRERMQIGRQLNRSTPKLDNSKYSDGLKSLVSFALESNPVSRPAMADILTHPYIADTEETHPTSSLSELVRMYYQWSQRGGQRISLFHPGGAAAAEMPDSEPSDEDWNFSTTDGFERRFSVIDLDQLAASIAELEAEISPTTKPQSMSDIPDEPSGQEMTIEDKANFDERVRRGAEAMEGLFNEEKPSYTYETKNDFVPIEPKPPASDLPLRTETDRSSVTSTFIDIDIGSFDSSHYAAGASSAQPFQLADADTIRANRSSGRQQRNSTDGRSRSSSSGVSSTRDADDVPFQPSTGPRPPTMDWKFPVFMQPATEEEPEPAPAPAPEPAQAPKPAELDTSEKRATMEWTFPVMTAPADDDPVSHESDADVTHNNTLKAPIMSLQTSDTIRRSSIGEPGDSRPSTSRSIDSNVSASSETDYDPFRFDRPSTPPGAPAAAEPKTFDESDFPTMSFDEDEETDVFDGPGPDEEEESTSAWHENPEQQHSHSEPFPTAIPVKDLELAPFPSTTDSPTSEPLPTARRNLPILSTEDTEPVRFPDVPLPRLDALTEGVGDHAIKEELDRMLDGFLHALNATGRAISQTTVGPEAEVNSDMVSTPEHSE